MASHLELVDAGPGVGAQDAALARGRRLRQLLHWALEGPGWPLLHAVLDCAAATGGILAIGSRSDLLALSFLPIALIAANLLRSGYLRDNPRTVLEEVGALLGVLGVGLLSVAAVGTYATPAPVPLDVLVAVAAVTAFSMVVGRAALASGRRLARQRGLTGRRALIVGSGRIARRVAERLRADPAKGLVPLGFVDIDPADPEIDVRILGDPDDLCWLCEAVDAEHVVVAFGGAADDSLSPLVRRCHEAGIGVTVVPRMFESMTGRMHYDRVGGTPVLHLGAVDPEGWQFALKHAADRLVAGACLLVLAPLLTLIALAVRLSSPGPVLFRQRRIGRDGREFALLKFRTMRVVEDTTPGFVPRIGAAPGGVEGADRRTAVGRVLRRTGLDELPQLANVLVGEMSLVGPRPERPEFVDRFSRELERYDERHRVKSGITGWAQVHGLRGQTSLSDRIEWDNWYIQHWSLGLDLRILLMTFRELWRGGE